MKCDLLIHFSLKKIRSKKMCIWNKFNGGDARALKYEGSIGSAALTFIRQQQKTTDRQWQIWKMFAPGLTLMEYAELSRKTD